MLKNKKSIIIVLLISMIFVLSGFTSGTKANTRIATTYPVTFTDIYKNTVTIDKEPNRIISVSPTLTEIVCSLGGFKKLVGRTDYCDYPSAVSKVPSIGGLLDPNIEKIVALKPDLVLASNLLSKDSYNKLQQLGIKVLIVSDTESFEGTYNTIAEVGKVINASDNADRVIANMKYKVNLVTKMTKNATKPSVYYVVGYGKYGDFTATGDTFISNMIEMAGGVNSAKDGSNWKYSIEQLLQKNPNILICSKLYDSKKGIAASVGYKDLTAVKKGKLLEIDDNLISRQGPRLADGLYTLAKLIHPQLFR